MTSPSCTRSVGDRHGNLIYEKSAQNFNPLCAQAGRITIAEVEELVEPGEIDPGQVHTPGIFVQRVVVAANPEKRIEKSHRAHGRPPSTRREALMALSRDELAARVAAELNDGRLRQPRASACPRLCRTIVRDGITVVLHSENGISGSRPVPRRRRTSTPT